MDQLSGQRNTVLDAAKGIGILLVVFAHVNFLDPWQSIIYGFHMPLFYIIAGMLFHREKYPSFGPFFKRRFRTLIVPYLIFSFVSLFCSYLLFLLRTAGTPAQRPTWLLSELLQVFIAQKSLLMNNVPLWFVPNLLLIECIYYFISGIRSRPLQWAIILALVFAGWFTESAYCPVDFSVLPWNFSSALFSLGFYALGNHFPGVFLDPVPPLLKNKHVPRRLLIFALCFAAEAPLAVYNGHVSVGSRILNNGFVFYATGILGTIGMISLASLIRNSRFFTFCGRSSFDIMATHKLFASILFAFSSQFFSYSLEESYYRWGESLFVFVVISAASLLFAFCHMKLKNKPAKKSIAA